MDIPEADNIFDPEEFENYVNMELALDRHNNRPEFARVNNILKDKDGGPIGIAADNKILDTSMYAVEYADGYKTAITDNAISSNLFSQVAQDGQHFLLFNAIIDLRTNSTYIKEGGYFIHISNGNKRRRETTKNGKFAYNGKIGLLLGTKLRTSRRASQYN